MTAHDDGNPGPRMTTRTALILTISLLAALGAGILLLQGTGRHLAEAIIGGTGVFITALKLLHQWITPDRPGEPDKH
jgi:hypothetical protein